MRILILGSKSDQINKKYRDIIVDLCTRLTKLDHKMVFNGNTSGLLGNAFMVFKYEDKKTKAVADLSIADEVNDLELDRFDIVKNTFERTKGLYESSELVLVLPGGIGTLAELFSIIEEKRTRKRNIPIIIFNYDNYYTSLLNVLTKMYEEHFVSYEDLKLFDIVKDINMLEKYLKKLEKRN